MIRYIDTHTHLYDEAFDIDRDETIERIIASGVKKCILPGIDMASFRRQQDFIKQYNEFAFPAIGLHPTSVNNHWREELDFVVSELKSKSTKYYAVGEIGLDGYWSKEFMKEQMEVFKKQIIMAYEMDLPIIVHARDATDLVFDVLDQVLSEVKETNKRLRGVFHAFSGSIETFLRLNKYGDFKVGIGGVVTYKKANVADTIVKIPLSSILLETDSPWLTPAPFRGKRNESSYIKYIAEKISNIKEVPLDEIASVTTYNAEQLFKI
jgi:hydrolase, TatD family